LEIRARGRCLSVPPQPKPIRVMRVIADADAMQDASSSANVDDEPPDLAVTEAQAARPRARLRARPVSATLRSGALAAAARYRQDAVYGAIEAELELAAAPTEPAALPVSRA
jgi:hypothetical protein